MVSKDTIREVIFMLASDSELKVLTYLWKCGSCKASHISKVFEEEIGWAPNTTYTIIRRAIKKGLITRSDPGFICTPNVKQEDLQASSINELRKNLFDNSPFQLVKSLISNNDFSDEEINELYSLIDKEKRSK